VKKQTTERINLKTSNQTHNKTGKEQTNTLTSN